MPQIDEDFLTTLADLICYCTDPRSGVEPDGQALAAAVTDLVREQYADPTLQKKHQREKIRSAVRSQYNGRNCQALMDRYNISRATLYRYLNQSHN